MFVEEERRENKTKEEKRELSLGEMHEHLHITANWPRQVERFFVGVCVLIKDKITTTRLITGGFTRAMEKLAKK